MCECEGSERLLAWMDGELSAEEAVAVDRHVGDCVRCRDRMFAYQRVSADVKAYRDALIAAEHRHRHAPAWVGGATGVAAIAAALALTLSVVVPRVRPAATPGLPQIQVSRTAAVQKLQPALSDRGLRRVAAPDQAVTGGRVKSIRQRRVARLTPPESWTPTESAIEILIPADAVFPPGAVPEGISFQAQLTVGRDGSAEWLWLQPWSDSH
jgi:hypothetical protein